MTLRTLAIAALATLVSIAIQPSQANAETAIFAGGCFWCVEADFDKVRGVTSTTSGYAGGHVKDPTYRQVVAGGTGHYEAVKVEFNPSVVSYEQLVSYFFHTVDPTDAGGQFCDRGQSYRTAIFPTNGEQRQQAEASKATAQKELGSTIVTKVVSSAAFYPAEDYHQNYYKKAAQKYQFYRVGCGRDAKIKRLWGNRAFKLGATS